MSRVYTGSAGEGMKHNTKFVSRFLAFAFAGLFVFMLAMLAKNPTDRVLLDNDGTAYVERSAWWGLSKHNVPLRRINGFWNIQTAAGWMPYQVEPDFGPDPPNSLDR